MIYANQLQYFVTNIINGHSTLLVNCVKLRLRFKQLF
jgi:hypothetical protein